MSYRLFRMECARHRLGQRYEGISETRGAPLLPACGAHAEAFMLLASKEKRYCLWPISIEKAIRLRLFLPQFHPLAQALPLLRARAALLSRQDRHSRLAQ